METVNKDKYKKLSHLYMYILYFFVFAFLGWVLETLYGIYELGHFTKRGFLYGPICPIYGYGAIILILFLSKYRKSSLKLFFSSIIIFSVFEYLVSFGLDALFASNWWDYSNDFFNLNGRISAFYSASWGFIAIIFLNHLFPFIKKSVNKILIKIPYKIQELSVLCLFFILVVDTILSILKNLNI